MSNLFEKRQSFMIDIRKNQLSKVLRSKRENFINQQNIQKQDSELEESTKWSQWKQLALELIRFKDGVYIDILERLKSLSSKESILQQEHSIQFLNRLVILLTEPFDLSSEQYLSCFILSNLTYSANTSNILMYQTNVLQILIRRFKVIGDLGTKQGCLWIFNNLMISSLQNISERLLENKIIEDLICYFREQPTPNQLMPALHTIILIIKNPQKRNYTQFKKLMQWIQQFLTINQKKITYFCTAIISLFSDMEYGEMALLDMKNGKLFKRISMEILPLKKIMDAETIILINSFLSIVEKYSRNSSFHIEITQMDVVRLLRILISIQGISRIYSPLFLTLYSLTQHQSFTDRILKDDLFKLMIEFYLNSSGSMHISCSLPLMRLILSTTQMLTQEDHVSQLRRMIEKDVLELGGVNNQSQQLKKLTHSMQLALAHIMSFFNKYQRV